MRDKGFTLIEVMIAMLLGSLIMVTFLKMLLNNLQASRYNQYQLRAQQNIRLANHYLSEDVRMAGAQRSTTGNTPSPFLRGSCGSVTNCTSDGGINGDTIAVQFEPVSGLDCARITVPQGEMNVNYYYIENNSFWGGEPVATLFCRGFDPVRSNWRGPPAILVSGIEQLQFLYGYADTVSDEVTSYRTADAVGDWNKVRSVQIGILANGGFVNGVGEQRLRSYNLMGSGAVSFSDRTPRYMFSSVSSIFSTQNGLDGAVLWLE